MRNVNEILKLMNMPPEIDKMLIKKAFIFSENIHREEKRFSGEPYFEHVYETAKILAKLGMDGKTIAAGLLHDTLENGAIETIDLQI